MILAPIFTQTDFDLVAAINNLTADKQLETGANNQLDTIKNLGVNIYKETEITPVSFDYLVNTYIERAATRQVTIQESKGTIRGTALQVTKLYPPSVENFLLEAKINLISFNNINNIAEYANSIQRLKTFCTEKILSLTLLNQINASISKLYLINISSLKDVSFIESNSINNDLPSWMTDKNLTFNSNNKSIDGNNNFEEIEIEEVTVKRLQ